MKFNKSRCNAWNIRSGAYKDGQGKTCIYGGYDLEKSAIGFIFQGDGFNQSRIIFTDVVDPG